LSWGFGKKKDSWGTSTNLPVSRTVGKGIRSHQNAKGACSASHKKNSPYNVLRVAGRGGVITGKTTSSGRRMARNA